MHLPSDFGSRHLSISVDLANPLTFGLPTPLPCPFSWSIFGHLLLRPTKFHAAMQRQCAVAAPPPTTDWGSQRNWPI